jgi:hypothetical protein
MRTEMNSRIDKRCNGTLSSLRFDYESVPSSVAVFLRGQADRIQRQCTTSVIQIGKALLEAKRHLSHGEFLHWVESEVCIPVRTAQAYMRVANWASDKGATVAHLSPSALYLLSATGVPEDFVAGILRRSEAGEYLAPSKMRGELKALRANEQQERVGSDIFAERTLKTDSKRGAVAIVHSGAGGKLNEFVVILARGLSAADFARVRDIVTSEAVLSDTQLAQHLERAFSSDA